MATKDTTSQQLGPNQNIGRQIDWLAANGRVRSEQCVGEWSSKSSYVAYCWRSAGLSPKWQELSAAFRAVAQLKAQSLAAVEHTQPNWW
jgi:hypothetical protein